MKAARLRVDCRAYTAAMNACTAGGQPERARQLYLEMRQAGLTPTPPAYSGAACLR